MSEFTRDQKQRLGSTIGTSLTKVHDNLKKYHEYLISQECKAIWQKLTRPKFDGLVTLFLRDLQKLSIPLDKAEDEIIEWCEEIEGKSSDILGDSDGEENFAKAFYKFREQKRHSVAPTVLRPTPSNKLHRSGPSTSHASTSKTQEGSLTPSQTPVIAAGIPGLTLTANTSSTHVAHAVTAPSLAIQPPASLALQPIASPARQPTTSLARQPTVSLAIQPTASFLENKPSTIPFSGHVDTVSTTVLFSGCAPSTKAPRMSNEVDEARSTGQEAISGAPSGFTTGTEDTEMSERHSEEDHVMGFDASEIALIPETPRKDIGEFELTFNKSIQARKQSFRKLKPQRQHIVRPQPTPRTSVNVPRRNISRRAFKITRMRRANGSGSSFRQSKDTQPSRGSFDGKPQPSDVSASVAASSKIQDPSSTRLISTSDAQSLVPEEKSEASEVNNGAATSTQITVQEATSTSALSISQGNLSVNLWNNANFSVSEQGPAPTGVAPPQGASNIQKDPEAEDASSQPEDLAGAEDAILDLSSTTAIEKSVSIPSLQDEEVRNTTISSDKSEHARTTKLNRNNSRQISLFTWYAPLPNGGYQIIFQPYGRKATILEYPPQSTRKSGRDLSSADFSPEYHAAREQIQVKEEGLKSTSGTEDAPPLVNNPVSSREEAYVPVINEDLAGHIPGSGSQDIDATVDDEEPVSPDASEATDATQQAATNGAEETVEIPKRNYGNAPWFMFLISLSAALLVGLAHELCQLKPYLEWLHAEVLSPIAEVYSRHAPDVLNALRNAMVTSAQVSRNVIIDKIWSYTRRMQPPEAEQRSPLPVPEQLQNRWPSQIVISNQKALSMFTPISPDYSDSESPFDDGFGHRENSVSPEECYCGPMHPSHSHNTRSGLLTQNVHIPSDQQSFFKEDRFVLTTRHAHGFLREEHIYGEHARNLTKLCSWEPIRNPKLWDDEVPPLSYNFS